MVHVAVRPRPVLALRAAVLTLALSPCALGGCTRGSGTRLDGRPAADVAALRLAEHRDEVVLLTFGFTSCPDVCPLTLSRMKALYRALGAAADRVAMAFVTVDPDRDRPAVLATHVAAVYRPLLPYFVAGRRFAASLAAYGATATKRITDPDRYHRVGAGAAAATPYTVDHTSGFFVVDRRGRLRLHEAHDVPADALAADVRRLLAEEVPPPVRVEQAVARLTPSDVGAIYFRKIGRASW